MRRAIAGAVTAWRRNFGLKEKMGTTDDADFTDDGCLVPISVPSVIAPEDEDGYLIVFLRDSTGR